MPNPQPAPAREAFFLNGFSMSWERLPHRVRRLAFAVVANQTTSSDGEEMLWGTLRADTMGGVWANGKKRSDFTQSSLTYTRLSGDLPIGCARVSLTLRGSRQEAASGEESFVVDLGQPLAPGTPVTALLAGFSFDTHRTHPNGFTLQGLSLSLSEPSLEGGQARVTLKAEVAAGAVPDRLQRLGRYEVVLEAQVVVVALPQGEVGRASVFGQADRLGTGGVVKVAKIPLSSPGPLAVGLAGFSFSIHHEGRFEGRYLRSLAVKLGEPTRADDGVLIPAFLYLSNAGQFPRRLRYHASVDVVGLSAPGASATRSQWTSSEPTSRHSHPLNLGL